MSCRRWDVRLRRPDSRETRPVKRNHMMKYAPFLIVYRTDQRLFNSLHNTDAVRKRGSSIRLVLSLQRQCTYSERESTSLFIGLTNGLTSRILHLAVRLHESGPCSQFVRPVSRNVGICRS